MTGRVWRGTAAAALTALALGAAACGSDDSSSGDAAAGGAATPATSAKTAKAAVVVKNFTNPFWVALRDGAQAEGKDVGVDHAVEGGASETDSAGQNAKISTLVNQGYSCFAAASVNSTNVITPLLAASRKGYPVISLDTPINPDAAKKAGLELTSFIGSNNVKVGQTAGEYMLELTGGKGKVLLLEGTPGAIPGIDRINGFSDAVKGKLEIAQKTPANFEKNKGLQVAEAMLKAHPDVVGIYAANDLMALGAAQAVQNAGKKGKIFVIGNDGIKESLEAVASGKLAGTVSQYPYVMGVMAIDACQALANGKSVPAVVESPIQMIKKADAAKAIASFPKPYFDYDNPLRALATAQ
jgi:ribose transport system substrate-binding protein